MPRDSQEFAIWAAKNLRTNMQITLNYLVSEHAETIREYAELHSISGTIHRLDREYELYQLVRLVA